jgi:hypothetical protein
MSCPASAYSSRLIFTIQPVILSDDDGSRQTQITPAQIRTWVDRSNRIWKHAGIGFELQNEPLALRSTQLNAMMGETDADWDAKRNAANRVAWRYPGRLVVFFRFGPGPEPTHHSFSWTDVGFVVMGGFEGNVICGRENLDLLAHEIGHYFGLSHTFTRTFGTIEEAEQHLKARAETTPAGSNELLYAPFIRSLTCTSETSVTLAGRTLPIPRNNLMSYYGRSGHLPKPDVLTPHQMAWARRIAELRILGAGRLPVNTDAASALQFEQLEQDENSGVMPAAELTGESWGGGKALFCRAVKGGHISFRVPVPAGGRYRMELYAAYGPDYGNLRVLLDGRVVKREIRAWAPLVTPSGIIVLGASRLSQGAHTLRIEIGAKQAASHGHNLALDALRLTRQ